MDGMHDLGGKQGFGAVRYTLNAPAFHAEWEVRVNSLYALAVHPVSAIWVGLLFLFIHQIEGHVVVPNVMGQALRLHPLLVIFGLLAGGEIYGLPGIFVALPLLAVARAVWEFFGERIELEKWDEGGTVPVEVEVEPPEQTRPRAVDLG